MQIEQIKISDLKNAKYNPRRLTDVQFKNIQDSLNEFGFVKPIVVNKNNDRKNVIIGGHMRVRVWEKMGNPEVPVVFVDLPLEKEKQLNIRLNKNTGEWDSELLANGFELESLLKWGFEQTELIGFEPVEQGETDGDDDIPDIPDPVTNIGDLYELGDHRLICGDSTINTTISNVLKNSDWDVCLFDPPYEKEYLYDNIPTEKTKKLLIFWDFKRFAIAPHKCLTIGWKPQYEFIWDCCQSWYTPNRPLQRHKSVGYFCDDPKFDTGLGIIVDGKDRGKKRIVSNTRGKCEYTPLDGAVHIRTVEQFPNTQQKDEHGHGKPVGWISAILLGIGGKYIFDMFLGSGSTIIACEKTDKICYGIEIDPNHCDVIVKRYIDFCKKNGRDWSVKRNGNPCGDDFLKTANYQRGVKENGKS